MSTNGLQPLSAESVSTHGGLEVIHLGLLDYGKALELQRQRLTERIEQRKGDALLMVQHPPTYTLGARRTSASHLLLDETTCRQRGIAVHQTSRGGDVTCHSPGQLVCYPIVSIEHRRDLHAYLRFLENVILETLAIHGLTSVSTREGLTGIWIGDRKIAAIGVAVRRWVTWHGLAINVSNNLTLFDGIVPCGLNPCQFRITSLHAELGPQPSNLPGVDEVAGTLARIFARNWAAFETQ